MTVWRYRSSVTSLQYCARANTPAVWYCRRRRADAKPRGDPRATGTDGGVCDTQFPR